MERHEIEAFLTLAEELHFGRSAERLHVSTARVSQTIRRLERRVGVALFERTSRRVALTQVGRQLHDELRPAYAQVREAFRRAVDAGRGVGGELRAGFVGAAAGHLLVRTAEEFGRRHPDCQVRLREVQTGEAPMLLRAGEVDVLLACLPVHAPDVVTGPVLLSEPRMLAVPSRHRLAARMSVTVAEAAGERAVRTPCSLPDYWVGTDGPPEPDGAAAGTFQEALTLVGAGRGVFVVGAHAARYHARPDVAYLPLRDAPRLDWGLVWPSAGATARVRAFASAAVSAGVAGRR